MRIFTDIASHDTTGVAPGGRIVRTDSTPVQGEETPINGQWVFPVPEGAALTVDSTSFWFPQEDLDSIPSRTASELLIRYPMYDHIIYNFYLDNGDTDAFDLSSPTPQPTVATTTPPMPTILGANAVPRCQLGGPTGAPSVGMVPNSLGVLPRTEGRPNNLFGSLVTAMIDLWYFNPCYIEVNDPVTLNPGDIVSLDALPLEAIAGVRVSGADNFSLSSGTAAGIAADIVAAINDPINSFSTLVLATIDPTVPSRIQLRPVPPTNTQVTVVAAGGVTGFTLVESHPGTDEVMMWWKVNRMTVTEDQGNTQATTPIGNTPAIKSLVEINEEDPDLLVYASVDDGNSWYRIPYLEPIDLINAGTELRVAFINLGTDKIYVEGFCVLFPDLLPPL
ncbi:MAG: hypothetical protein CMJ67_10635 [Planctomycetaceae bacterium]|nr:hypothetical protein [Planctomycetaceae bacterium]